MSAREREESVVPLSALSRRGFCQAAGVGLAAAALPACFGDGGTRVGIGAVDDTDAGVPGGDSPPPDFAGTHYAPPDLAGNHHAPPDLAHSQGPPPDMAHAAQQGNCPGGVYSTGKPPASFALNTATYFNSQDAFVCRDSGGLFALSSICTHSGCTNKASNGGFRCPCHGATFSLNGDVTRGPAWSPLDNYAVCLDDNGNVAFDVNNVVAAGTRMKA